MSFFELSFKIVGTVILILLFVGILHWLWTHQIDPRETFKRLFRGKAKGTVDWIATRDQDAIYQNGQIVGRVSGDVQEMDNEIVFHEIYDTSVLNTKEPFEYRRHILKIISKDIIGQKIVTTPEGSEVKQNVIMNVVCEKIR